MIFIFTVLLILLLLYPEIKVCKQDIADYYGIQLELLGKWIDHFSDSNLWKNRKKFSFSETFSLMKPLGFGLNKNKMSKGEIATQCSCTTRAIQLTDEQTGQFFDFKQGFYGAMDIFPPRVCAQLLTHFSNWFSFCNVWYMDFFLAVIYALKLMLFTSLWNAEAITF